MNSVFFALVTIAFLVTAWHQIGWIPPTPDAMSPMDVLTAAVVDAAGQAVTLAIGLVGMMSLFLGLMKVGEAGGLLTMIAKTMRPLMTRAFPEVPPNHPAMGAMIMNLSANALGLGNAATPFGIRAMQELDTLNPHKGTATNAMVLFLAINTSSVTLLPTGVIALRAAAGSTDPAGILATTLFATTMSTTTAIIAAKLLQRWFPFGPEPSAPGPAADRPGAAAATSATEVSLAGAEDAYPPWVSAVVLAGVMGLIPLGVFYGRAIAPWVIPGLMVLLLTFGLARRIRVYEVLVDGARDGFQVALRIIPYLVAILVAVAMFRASGALDVLVATIGPATSRVGLPAEALPMALLRPLSGSGAFAYLASILKDPAIGPDSYVGYLVSTIQGATETTFYVLAVYFGAVQVRRVRHAIAAGLIADVAGVAGAILACSYLYGGR